MSDWKFLNQHRVVDGPYATLSSDGFNGAFQFALPGEPRRVCVIASDGAVERDELAWQHVSVSFGPNHSIPPWLVMQAVKELFFEDDDWVMQFHPAKKDYVNNHLGCLHLWRPV